MLPCRDWPNVRAGTLTKLAVFQDLDFDEDFRCTLHHVTKKIEKKKYWKRAMTGGGPSPVPGGLGEEGGGATEPDRQGGGRTEISYHNLDHPGTEISVDMLWTWTRSLSVSSLSSVSNVVNPGDVGWPESRHPSNSSLANPACEKNLTAGTCRASEISH